MPRAPVRQILSPQIHLLGNSSEAAGAGRAERPGVCPPIPHQAGVALVCLLSCSATLARGGPFPRAHAWLAISRGAPQSLLCLPLWLPHLASWGSDLAPPGLPLKIPITTNIYWELPSSNALPRQSLISGWPKVHSGFSVIWVNSHELSGQPNISRVFYIFVIKYLFIFGCAGSSLLHAGFLYLQPTGAAL